LRRISSPRAQCFCHHFQGIVFDLLLYVHTLVAITIKVEGLSVEKLVEEHFLNVHSCDHIGSFANLVRFLGLCRLLPIAGWSCMVSEKRPVGLSLLSVI
jgi:hypothetical protein